MNKPASKIIEEDIKNKIQMRVYDSGETLPSENELAEKYEVSRATVQKALSAIIADKLIYSVPGKGYFVREVNFNKYTFNYGGFSKNAKYIAANIISPPAEVIYYLHIHPKKKVLETQRLSYDGEKPTIYDIMYTPYTEDLDPYLDEYNIAKINEIIHTFVSPYEIERKISFETEYAPKDICTHLNVPFNTLMVVAERSIMNEEGECFAWGKRYILPEYFNLVLER